MNTRIYVPSGPIRSIVLTNGLTLVSSKGQPFFIDSLSSSHSVGVSDTNERGDKTDCYPLILGTATIHSNGGLFLSEHSIAVIIREETKS